MKVEKEEYLKVRIEEEKPKFSLFYDEGNSRRMVLELRTERLSIYDTSSAEVLALSHALKHLAEIMKGEVL